MSVLPAQRKLELPYRWYGAEGLVRVEFGVNDDPDRFGGAEFGRGFPYCRATIHPPATGYKEMIGWVQMAKLSDRGEGFQIDQFEPLGGAPNPFTLFGYSPLFFDGPHTDLPDWDFAAHTFLCGLGGKLFEQTEGKRREVLAILGFAWGFSKRGSQIDSLEPTLLSGEDWDHHLPYLRRRFSKRKWIFRPGQKWTFRPGFSDHPLP